MAIKNFTLPRLGTPTNPIKLGVLISGSGSGMEALLNFQNQKVNCSHKTVLVISNKTGVKGLEIAESKGIPNSAIELPRNVHTGNIREQHEELIHTKLVNHAVEVVVLSGYMRVLTSIFVERWEGRLINIHPSLLPNFPGAHAHKDVLASGVEESGCTVHFVDPGIDTGLIITQRKVPVLPDDTLTELQNRIKKEEHILYPQVIDALCENRLHHVMSSERLKFLNELC